MAFVKDDAAKAAGLVASIQKLANTHRDKGLKTFVVFTGGPELKDPIEKVAADHSISIPLTFLPQGTNASDYAQFKVNPDAHNTVLVYKDKRVTANFVNVTKATFAEVEKATAETLTR